MIYFKNVPFRNQEEKLFFENALRKTASKRGTRLGFIRASTDTGTDYYFFGFEGKTEVLFTRIRSSLELLLPKLVISLPRSPDKLYYRVGTTYLPAFFFVMMLCSFIYGLLFRITHAESLEGYLTFSFIYVIYALLIFIEFTLTNGRIKKALRKLTQTSLSAIPDC